MRSKIATFCNAEIKYAMCCKCERHVKHSTNKQYKDGKQTTMKYIPSESTIQGLTCTGHIIYPGKETKNA